MQGLALSSSFTTDAQPVFRVAFASANGKDHLILSLQNLLWIQAQENYVQFCWEEGEQVYTTLLRNTLTSVYQQLPDCFIQTHRSYVVNLKQLRSLRKRGAGFLASLGDSPKTVPVSRLHAKQVVESVRYEKPHLRP